MSFEELFVDLQAESVIRRGPILREIRLERPYVHIVRRDDGSYNFSDLVAKFTSGSGPRNRCSHRGSQESPATASLLAQQHPGDRGQGDLRRPAQEGQARGDRSQYRHPLSLQPSRTGGPVRRAVLLGQGQRYADRADRPQQAVRHASGGAARSEHLLARHPPLSRVSPGQASVQDRIGAARDAAHCHLHALSGQASAVGALRQGGAGQVRDDAAGRARVAQLRPARGAGAIGHVFARDVKLGQCRSAQPRGVRPARARRHPQLDECRPEGRQQREPARSRRRNKQQSATQPISR